MNASRIDNLMAASDAAFRLGDHDRLPSCALPMQETNYEFQKVGKCLLIGLPSWAWDAKRKAEMEAIAKRGEKP